MTKLPLRLLAATSALIMLLPPSIVSAQHGVAPPALSPEPCARVSLTTNPTVAAPTPGSTLSVITNLTNCSSQPETVTLEYTFAGPDTPACPADLPPYTTTLTVMPRASRGLSFDRPQPHCPGLYPITVAVVADDGSELASTETLFSVGFRPRHGA